MNVARKVNMTRFQQVWLVLLTTVALAVSAQNSAPSSSSAGAGKQDYPAEQIDAYVALIQADQARDHGNWKTAIQQYREAMKQYAQLVEKNPNWNPEIVQFRLSYCQNEVQAILKKTGKNEAELLAGPAITAEDENASYKERFDALKRDYEKSREESAQLRKDSAMNEAVAKNLQVEARRLEKDNNRLRLELTAATSQSDRNASDVEQRRQEIATLKDQIEVAQVQIQKGLREKQAVEKARFESEQMGIELSKSLADTRRAKADIEGKIDALQQQLDTTKKNLTDYEQRFAAASNAMVRASSANERLQAEIKATGKLDVEKYRKESEAAKTEADLLTKKLATMERETDSRGEQVALLVKDRRAASNDLVAARAEIAALTKQRDTLQSGSEKDQKALARYAELAGQLAQQKADAAVLEKKLAAAEKSRDALQPLADTATKIQAKLDDANRQIAQQKSDFAAMEQRLAAAEKARDDARSLAGSATEIQVKLKDGNKMIEQQKADAAKLELKVAAAEKARDAAQALSAMAAKIQAKLDDANKAAEQQKADTAKLELKVTAAEKARDAAQALSATTAEIQAKLNAANRVIEQQKSDMAKLDQKAASAEKSRDAFLASSGNAGKIQAKLDDVNKVIDQQKTQVAQLQKDLSAARDQVEQTTRAAKSARAEAAELQSAKGEAEHDARINADAVAKLTRENKDLQQRIKSADSVAKSASASADELKKIRDQLDGAQAEAAQLKQALTAANNRAMAAAMDADKMKKDGATIQTENARLRKQLDSAMPTDANAPVPAGGDLEKMKKDLAAARDEVKTWSAKHDTLNTALDGVKQRLAEMSKEMTANDRKAQAQEKELLSLNKDYADAKESLAAAQKRIDNLEEQNHTLSAAKISEAEKLKKHAAALSETIDLNQKELERLRGEIKAAKDKIDQLQTENAKLKK